VGDVTGRVTLHVADAALVSIATATAGAVPGVLGLRADRSPRLGSLVRVRIVVRMGDNCRDVAEAVQRAVTHTLAEQAGQTVTVEVTVAEVLLR
jgi:uncharacterized alkaline shock family protein YloU